MQKRHEGGILENKHRYSTVGNPFSLRAVKTSTKGTSYMKKLMIGLIALCLLVCAVPAAFAAETNEANETTEAVTQPGRDPDSCGEDLKWSYSSGVLTVTGTGAMDDMTGGAPWASYKDSITSVVLSGGVTTVGAEAFRDYDGITSIDFGDSLREIDTRAFQSCDGLEQIRLPATFKRFGQECFQNCAKLTTVYCAGGMPSFKANCLWNGNFVTVYCPWDNVWPEVYVEELERNFGGRLEIMASDGSDPFDFTEPAETTQATTVPTTEAATEPATQATTQPVTEETEAPETQAPTTVPVETTLQTQEVTEAPTQPSRERTGSAVGIAAAVMVISAAGIGIILYALKSGKGGKYAR